MQILRKILRTHLMDDPKLVNSWEIREMLAIDGQVLNRPPKSQISLPESSI